MKIVLILWSLAIDAMVGVGGATLTLTAGVGGVTVGGTKGEEEVGVATDDFFFPLETSDLRCFK